MSDPAIVDLVTFFEDVPPSDAQASASTPAFDDHLYDPTLGKYRVPGSPLSIFVRCK